MRFALSFLALAAVLPSCTQRTTKSITAPHKPRTVSTTSINTAPSDTVLVFRRTPCFGRCPAYTATVFGNGRVSYYGERFTPLAGQQTLQLEPPTVAAMLAEAQRINFTALAPSYRTNVSDLPGVAITVYLPGQRGHKVFAEHQAAPPALQGYIDYLGARLDPLAGLNETK